MIERYRHEFIALTPYLNDNKTKPVFPPAFKSLSLDSSITAEMIGQFS